MFRVCSLVLTSVLLVLFAALFPAKNANAVPCTVCQQSAALIETLTVAHYHFPHIVIPQQPAIADRINEFLRTEVLVPIVADEARHDDSQALLQHIFTEAALVSDPSRVEYSGIAYQMRYNANNILALTITVEFMGAYPSVKTHYLNFSLVNGAPLMPSDLLKNDDLKTELNRLIYARVSAYAQQIAADLDMSADEINEQVLASIDFTTWPAFTIQRSGLAFYVKYELPHAIRGLAPEEQYEFSYAELKPYLATDGVLGFILTK
jgi:hypothetical protein